LSLSVLSTAPTLHVALPICCSGGSYGSIQLADALPGLIDGALIACTFPDPLSIAFSGSDGRLLTHYFAVTNPAGFANAQKVAISDRKSTRLNYSHQIISSAY